MCLFSLVLGNGTQTSASILAAHCIYLLIHVDLGSECRAFLKVPPPCAPLIESMQAGLSVISEGQTNPFSDMEHRSKIHRCLDSKTVWLWGLESVAESGWAVYRALGADPGYCRAFPQICPWAFLNPF